MNYTDEKRNFTLTATGDIFITRKLSVYNEPEYLKMWDILRDADIKFTNFEMLIHEHKGFPVAQSGGTYTQVDNFMLDELKYTGFNLFSLANNHSLDYSAEAMMRTRELLDGCGFIHSGTGENLAEASSPKYLDLASGRVALVAASSSFAPHGRAGNSRPDMRGRPGLNSVRYDTYYEVDEEHFAKVVDLDKHLKTYIQKEMSIKSGWGKKEEDGECRVGANSFRVGDNPGVHTKVNDHDRKENLKWIKDGARQADFVVYSLHCHEGNWIDYWKPADFHQPFAHDCIDAGADAFLGHGSHYLRGIEIYNKKPIFYGLGNFVFQNETVRKLPHDVYEKMDLSFEDTPADYYDKRSNNDQRGFPAGKRFWQSILPKCYYENGELVKMEIYPITLGFGKKRTVRGRPMLATDNEAIEILEKIKELSAPFGTEIEIKDKVGYVKL